MQDLIAVGVKTHFVYHVVAKNNAYRQAAARRPRGSAGPDGRVRHRVRAGGDPLAPPRQQLPGVRAARQPAEPDLHRLLHGQRHAGRRARHDRRGHRSEGRGGTDLQEHSGVGAAGAGADRHQERQLGRRSLPRELGRQSRRLVAHAGVRRVGDRRSAHGQRTHPRAASTPSSTTCRHRRTRSGAWTSRGRAKARRSSARTAPRATSRGTKRSIRPRSSESIRIAPGSTPACPATGWPRSSPRPARSTASTTRASLVPPGACRRATGRRGSTSTSATRHAVSPRAPTATRRTCCTASGRRHPTCTTDRCRRWATCSARPRGRRGSCAATCTTTRRWWASNGATRPAARYSPNEILLVKEYDTTVGGKANGGHTFGSGLCPDTSGLDPVRDRAEIQTRIQQSPAGALLEYLKTL